MIPFDFSQSVFGVAQPLLLRVKSCFCLLNASKSDSMQLLIVLIHFERYDNVIVLTDPSFLQSTEVNIVCQATHRMV